MVGESAGKAALKLVAAVKKKFSRAQKKRKLQTAISMHLF